MIRARELEPEPARAQERVRRMAEALLALLAAPREQILPARLMAAVENLPVVGILLLAEVVGNPRVVFDSPLEV